MHTTVTRAAVIGTVAAAALAGAAVSFASGLPGAADDHAQTATTTNGASVPGTNAHSAGHADSRGSSAVGSTTSADASSTRSDVSDLATTTTLTGVEKGAAISTLASGGKSRAGQHGQAGGAADAPVSTPNGGGTGTADTASGGASSTGAATADSASGGASSTGSGNAHGH